MSNLDSIEPKASLPPRDSELSKQFYQDLDSRFAGELLDVTSVPALFTSKPPSPSSWF